MTTKLEIYNTFLKHSCGRPHQSGYYSTGSVAAALQASKDKVRMMLKDLNHDGLIVKDPSRKFWEPVILGWAVVNGRVLPITPPGGML